MIGEQVHIEQVHKMEHIEEQRIEQVHKMKHMQEQLIVERQHRIVQVQLKFERV